MPFIKTVKSHIDCLNELLTSGKITGINSAHTVKSPFDFLLQSVNSYTSSVAFGLNGIFTSGFR